MQIKIWKRKLLLLDIIPLIYFIHLFHLIWITTVGNSGLHLNTNFN